MALVEFVNDQPPYLNANNLNNNFNELDTKIDDIIESGSNTNGSYIKYSDGTMIQTGTGQCPSGVGYADITFPIEFIDTNIIMTANHKYTGGSGYGGSAQLRNITNPQVNTSSTAYVYSYIYDGSVASYIRNVQWVAIGRWK